MPSQIEEESINIRELVLDESIRQPVEFDPDNLVTEDEWKEVLDVLKYPVYQNRWTAVAAALMETGILNPPVLIKEERDKLWTISNNQLKTLISSSVHDLFDLNAAVLILSQPEKRDQIRVPPGRQQVLTSTSSNLLSRAVEASNKGFVNNALNNWRDLLQNAVIFKVLFPDEEWKVNPTQSQWDTLKAAAEHTPYLLTPGINGVLQALGYKLVVPQDLFSFSIDSPLVDYLEENAAELRSESVGSRLGEFLGNRAALKILLADEVKLDASGLKISYYRSHFKNTHEQPPEPRRF